MDALTIVTLYDKSGGFQVDLELPNTAPAEQLIPAVYYALKAIPGSPISNWNAIKLLVDGYEIQPQDSLFSLGIYDGRILEITES